MARPAGHAVAPPDVGQIVGRAREVLEQHGQHELAAEILASSLALVARSGFREYFEPFGGAGHGADSFSWTAALALDFAVRTGLTDD